MNKLNQTEPNKFKNDINECWNSQKNCNKSCMKRSCKYWIKSKDDLNCVHIGAEKGPKTLQDIGELYDLTRMRICQIEKLAIKKLKRYIK